MKEDNNEDKKPNNKKMGIISLVLVLLCAIGIFYFNSSKSSNISEDEYKRDNLLASTSISDIIYDSSKEISKGPYKTYGKVAYLTIDDGPSEYTEKYLKVLDDNNVKATFFMVNGNMKAYPDAVKHIVDSGNTAGLHSVTHDVRQLYKTNIAAKDEFDICAQTFKEITGKETKVIRLPFGSKPYTPQKSYENLVGAGYKLWDWTLDTEDWRSTPQGIMNNLRKYAVGDDIVVLVHEKSQTYAVLDDLIKYLKEEGYQLLPITQTQQEQNYWNGKLGSGN